MLRSGINGEVVTSVIHPISSKGLKENAEGTVAIEFPNVYIRPGEYPLYFWLGDLTKPVPVLDVVENLTAPLVVNAGENKIEQGF
jgi:hypothetical protein